MTHHVVIRGNGHRNIFVDDDDRVAFVARLDHVADVHEWQGLALCLMSNHVHICLTTTAANLSDGMRDLTGAYARRFNRRHGGHDHVLRARFWSKPVGTDSYLVTLLRYIAQNPVRAGLVDDAALWPWSSYGQLIGRRRFCAMVRDDVVLSLLHHRRSHAVALLRQLVEIPVGADQLALVERARPSTANLAAALEARHAARVAVDLDRPDSEIAAATGVPRTWVWRTRRQSAAASVTPSGLPRAAA